MNLSDVSSKKAVRTTPLNPADTRLHGRRLVLVRLLCLTLCVLSVGLFVSDIPSFIAHLHLLCTGTAAACQNSGQLTPGDVRRLHELGLSIDFFAIYLIVLSSIVALGYWLVAAFLFWRKSDDRLALLAAVSLGTFPMVFNSPLTNALPSPWSFLVHCIRFLGILCFGLFVYLFPSGHFVPSFMRWVFVVELVYGGFNIFFPVSSFNPFSTSQVLGGLIFLGLIGNIVVVQIYRYRRVSSPAQRQQTKWVVSGMSMGWGGYLVIFTLSLVFPSLFQIGSLVSLIDGIAVYGFMLLVPLSIGFAILRARLWDIDLIINRTLVYFGCVVALQALVRGLTGQASGNPLVVVSSTLVIAALFNPLRKGLQKLIDRRFYRRKYDAARTLAAFSATLRHEVDLNQLREDLVAVVQETMQPAHISLWLRQPEPSRERNTRFLPGIDEEESVPP